MEPPYNIQDPDKRDDFKVYTRRWYILATYSLYSFTQSVVWNTWGPISNTAEDAFDWHNSTVAWLNNWGPICYVLTGLLFPWLLQVKGLRWAALSSMFCVTVGTSFRVITSEATTATILIHVGQFMNGIGGPVSAGSIPAMSATWFPPSERVTATAFSNSINVFGTALAFILGPLLVPDTLTNKSSPVHKFLLFQSEDFEPNIGEPNNVTLARRHTEREDIMRYMYYVCGWSVFLFIVMLCYFPSKPPRPPCMSATIERRHYWKSLLSLTKKGYFLIMTMVFGISTGIFGAWTSVLNINLHNVSISEETSGWIGFYSTVAGCIGALLVGRFASHFVRHMKLIIMVMYILTTAALTVCTLMFINIVPLTEVGLYVTIVIASTALNIAIPLMYELACELAYPASEGAANGVMTLFSNLCALVFLAMLSIPNIGIMWMNWAVVGSAAVCIPLVALLKGRLARLEIDEGIQPERYTENVVVVPKDYREDDPLLQHEEVHSEASEHGGFQNPVLADAAKSSDADSSRSREADLAISRFADPSIDIPEIHGIPNPKLIDVSIPEDSNLDLNVPELYGIQDSVSQAVSIPRNDDQNLNYPVI